MADEEGPDPNSVRRHAKRLYTEMEYRKRYRRIDYYRPNRKQLEFHNTIARERMIRAGNQQGKTHAAGAQMTMDALAWYPEWYEGRRFIIPPKIERAYDFIGWAGCTTQEKTRDGIQLKLLGPLRDEGGLGTGLIPLDNIVKVTTSRGISEFADSVTIRRETGATGVIRLKTFGEGREGWQGESVDVGWVDEDPGNSGIYGELLARLSATGGQIICSLTPLLGGGSPLRRRFREKTPGTIEVQMGIIDTLTSNGGHFPDERLAEELEKYPENERETRLNGADMQGEGAVFVTSVAQIKHTLDPAEVPHYWPWLWGFDFRHSGSETTGHPFAAVLCCHNRDADEIYVMHAVRMLGLAPTHVAAMRQHPMWDAPVAWPHDGGRGASLIDGGTVAKVYAKLGMNMRSTHATFAGGGFVFENGIDEMQRRFAAGKLKVSAHLQQFFDEYQGYHRVNGLVNKIDDDLLSALRQAMMDIRYAKSPVEFRGLTQWKRGGGPPKRATGIDFDLF